MVGVIVPGTVRQDKVGAKLAQGPDQVADVGSTATGAGGVQESDLVTAGNPIAATEFPVQRDYRMPVRVGRGVDEQGSPDLGPAGPE